MAGLPRAGHAVGGQELPDAVLSRAECRPRVGASCAVHPHTAAPGNCIVAWHCRSRPIRRIFPPCHRPKGCACAGCVGLSTRMRRGTGRRPRAARDAPADGPARHRLDRHRPLRRARGRLVRRARADRGERGTPERVLEALARAGGVARSPHMEGQPARPARLRRRPGRPHRPGRGRAARRGVLDRPLDGDREGGRRRERRRALAAVLERSRGATRSATPAWRPSRWSTSPTRHPFWARPFADISVVHNGHITNYHKLRRRLEEKGHRFATGNDSEAIAVYIADKLAAGETLEDALRASVHDLDGTFAYLISTPRASVSPATGSR